MYDEITFIIKDDPEGGYIAHALNEAIFTQADNLSEMQDRIRDAIQCHFEDGQAPNTIHLHFVYEETIAL